MYHAIKMVIFWKNQVNTEMYKIERHERINWWKTGLFISDENVIDDKCLNLMSDLLIKYDQIGSITFGRKYFREFVTENYVWYFPRIFYTQSFPSFVSSYGCQLEQRAISNLDQDRGRASVQEVVPFPLSFEMAQLWEDTTGNSEHGDFLEWAT